MTEKVKSTDFLNKIVTVKMDRPIGTKHPKHDFTYPINSNELDSEYEFSLSTKQIMNIAKELSKYELPDIKDYLIALEYACKMRIQILNHIEHCEGMYQKRFNSFNNISYVVKRALSVIGKVEPVKPIDIKY